MARPRTTPTSSSATTAALTLATVAWLLVVCMPWPTARAAAPRPPRPPRPPRLAKPGSTHPSFPLDAFAKPTYKLVFADDEPVGNQTAREWLQMGRTAGTDGEDEADMHDQSQALSLKRKKTEAESARNEASLGEQQGAYQQSHNGHRQAPFRAYLHRSAPESLHVCTLAEPDLSPAGEQPQPDEFELRDHRRRVLTNALHLLSSLKDTCLFHTFNWFTYSLCYGDAIKQFRALPGTMGGGKTPAMDPSQPSFVLGRWREGVEAIRGAAETSASPAGRAAVTDGEREIARETHANEDVDAHGASEAAAASSGRLGAHEAGTELMELVHFSSLEGSETERGRAEMATQTALEGRGRYISQVWTDGTLCDMNDEPRTAEVQFHCADTPVRDRIALIKEVTTCNYVVVVETSRLCQEPALAQKEDEVREVRCRPIVTDEELQRRMQQRIADQHASLAIDAAKASTEREQHRQHQEQQQEQQKQVQDPIPESLGKDESPNHAKASSDSDGKSATPDNAASKDPAEQIRAALRRVMQKRNAAGQGHAQPAFDEVEVVVGWDEEGNFILEPRKGGAALNAEELLGQEGIAAVQEIAETHLNDREQLREADNPALANTIERLDAMLRRVDEMQAIVGGFEGAAGNANPDAAGSRANPANQEQPQPQQPHGHGQPAPQQPLQAKGLPIQPQTPQQRGRPMTREPESLGSRVERFYKAQEGRQRLAQAQAQANAQAAAAGGTDRDAALGEAYSREDHERKDKRKPKDEL